MKKASIESSALKSSKIAKVQPAAARRTTTSKAKLVKPLVNSTKSQTPAGASESKTKKTKKESVASVGVKARRVRAPKDLAIQYGEKTKAPRAPKVAKVEKRTRRDAAAKARLKELMTPDDDLMARLARAGMIASSLAPEDTENDNGSSRRKVASAPRRSRKWDSRCGKCGGVSTFTSAAGLCPKCGAIVVRD